MNTEGTVLCDCWSSNHLAGTNLIEIVYPESVPQGDHEDCQLMPQEAMLFILCNLHGCLLMAWEEPEDAPGCGLAQA